MNLFTQDIPVPPKPIEDKTWARVCIGGQRSPRPRPPALPLVLDPDSPFGMSPPAGWDADWVDLRVPDDCPDLAASILVDQIEEHDLLAIVEQVLERLGAGVVG